MAKILIVEDNVMNRDMLSRRLVKRGFEVAIAVDGLAGLAEAQSGKYDLVLMDMSLPGLSGWEATQKLREDPAMAKLPVIALTAHAMESDRQQALAAGCDEYETKPVDLARLLEKMNRLLDLTDSSA